jgi:hypothetical protein
MGGGVTGNCVVDGVAIIYSIKIKRPTAVGKKQYCRHK